MFYIAAGVVNHTQNPNSGSKNSNGNESKQNILTNKPCFISMPIDLNSSALNTRTDQPVIFIVSNNLDKCDCYISSNPNGPKKECNLHRSVVVNVNTNNSK